MIRIFRHYFSFSSFFFTLGEGVLIYLSVFLATHFFFDIDLSSDSPLYPLIWLKILLITLITQLSLHFNDLYSQKVTNDYFDLFTRIMQSIGITSITLAIIYFIFPSTMIGRGIYFISLIFLLLFIVSWRLLYAFAVKKRYFGEKAIILGNGELANDIINELDAKKDIGYYVSSIICKNGGPETKKDHNTIPVHYGFDKICEIARTEDCNNVIVALDEKRGMLPTAELLKCKVKGVNIIDGEMFYERITGKLLVEKIHPSMLIFSDGFVKSKTARLVKRTIGFFLACVGLLLLSPLLALIAIAIKLDSRGPVFYTQERVGENEKVFRMYKFRSMRADAEKISGPTWATDDDPRITRAGRFIRKLRIDELPQLINVLKGDMSFVGPRPEREFFTTELEKKIPYYKERFTVKPGITGYAQVLYPYGASEKDALEKLKYDLYYIKNMSLFLDFIVMVKTVKIVLLGRGAR